MFNITCYVTIKRYAFGTSVGSFKQTSFVRSAFGRTHLNRKCVRSSAPLGGTKGTSGALDRTHCGGHQWKIARSATNLLFRRAAGAPKSFAGV